MVIFVSWDYIEKTLIENNEFDIKHIEIVYLLWVIKQPIEIVYYGQYLTYWNCILWKLHLMIIELLNQ